MQAQALLNAALPGPKVKRPQPVDWTPTMVQAFEDCKSSLLCHTSGSPGPICFVDLIHRRFRYRHRRRLAAAYLRRLPTPGCLLILDLHPQQQYSPVRSRAAGNVRPSIYSDKWSKAVPLSSLRTTSLSLMVSRTEISAHHDISVLTLGMFQDKTTF
jgi:hypothetical protein